jgi:protein TonB
MKKTKQNQKEQKKMFYEYQGAELKNFYNKYIMRALVFSIAVHVVAVGAWFISSAVNDANADKKDEISDIRYIEVTEPPMINEQKVETPPDIEESKMIAKKDLAALIPTPVKKIDAQEITTKTQDQLDQIKVNVASDGDETGSNITDGTFVIKDKDIIENIEKDKDVDVNKNKDFQPFEVQVAPTAVNLGSVQGSMNYPQRAIDEGTEGRVVVKILIGKDGEVIKIGSISGPEVFKDEVRDKVYNLVFTPAIQNGNTVKCWVSVPFNFKLKSSFN